MKAFLTVLLASFVLACGSCYAQGPVLENNLADLNAVLVSPSLILDAFDSTNFTIADVKTIVEQKLSSSSVSIIPSQSKFNPKSDGILIVSVTTQKAPNVPSYAYTISVTVEENTISKRIHSPNNMMVATWQDQEYGVADTEGLRAAALKALDIELSLFITDYVKDNSKN